MDSAPLAFTPSVFFNCLTHSIWRIVFGSASVFPDQLQLDNKNDI